MNILLIGSGGREHALAWKILQSPYLSKLYMTATNGSILVLAKNSAKPVLAVDIAENDHPSLVKFAQEQSIELVIIGSETPLAAGLSDAFNQASIKVFGPSQAAAQIESSKVFAKDFMQRHHIPTARYGKFTQFEAAYEYLQSLEYPIVIKASGLAAGKGVFLPATQSAAEEILRALLLEESLGEAGQEIIIEEKLIGQEISLLAFTDGKTIKPMPPARDHKRLLAGNQGPNTGGMGVYAPVPEITNEQIQNWCQTILQPTIDGLRSENKPFVGVLYAGLMLTAQGAKVLEFNCRFGDPETQVLMPLLETDLIEIMYACVEQRLAQININWNSQTAVCIVVAAKDYPFQPQVGDFISGLEGTDLPGAPVQNELVKTQTSTAQYHGLETVKKDVEGYVSQKPVVVFHAATKWHNNKLVTAGGRVFGVTAWDKDLASARKLAYAQVKAIQFNGMQYRDDIGEV